MTCNVFNIYTYWVTGHCEKFRLDVLIHTTALKWQIRIQIGRQQKKWETERMQDKLYSETTAIRKR